jgi:hypothetical protein
MSLVAALVKVFQVQRIILDLVYRIARVLVGTDLELQNEHRPRRDDYSIRTFSHSWNVALEEQPALQWRERRSQHLELLEPGEALLTLKCVVMLAR